jgi:putative ABC transport system substrate-binding protein
MRRREFIGLVGGTAIWPVHALAQNATRVRRIAVFHPGAADNPEFEARNAAFFQELGQLGWVVGSNVRIESRWGSGNVERFPQMAQELVSLGPDVILGNGTAVVTALRKVTRTLPIVFANISDPVGSGLVASLARPGGNATGFISSEFSFSGKWLELLKQIAPQVTRVGVIRDSAIASQIGFLGGIQSVAPGLDVEVRPIDLSDVDEIEHAVETLARNSNGGLIVTPSGRAVLHRERIVKLAAQHGLPAVYPFRHFAAGGGLVSYGADTIYIYQQVARYIDRILKGEKPAELPVQAPTKYELVINLKTAKALNLTVPPTLLARADEVIE